MIRQSDVDLDEPLFIDLETRSAADLPKVGGWNYAVHPSTHIFSVAWSPAPDEYHIWYPWHDSVPAGYTAAQGTTAEQHFGRDVPEALLINLHRKWCAHNAWNFDALVWRAVMGDAYEPADWIDTEPLARAIGLPGGLDMIGKRLWGEGKYKAAKAVLKKHMHGLEFGDAANIPAGVLPMLGEYNVQDVFLLRGIWGEVKRWLVMPEREWDVLNAHRDINHRGAPLDEDLLVALIDLTDEGKTEAVKLIAELTKDSKSPLLTINDLQSRNKVFAWLDAIGVSVGSSLRKELVQQFIDTHRTEEEDDDENATDDEDEYRANAAVAVALAVQVLQLRSAALRITGGKLAAAADAVCADGRVRGLFVYAGAHTFRWAGRRVQVQNLPRPKEGIKVWEFVQAYEASRFVCQRPTLSYATVDALLPDRSDKRYRTLTPDDAASAMVRVMFHGGQDDPTMGDCFADEYVSDPDGLIVADLSGIEARVLAKLAGEKWLMDLFWAGGDPYIPMAEVVFGPRETWPGYDPKTLKKHPRRQVGKVIELGSGFQLGGTKMDVYAAAQGCDLAALGTSGDECVMAYRKSHPAIAGVVAGEYKGRPYFRDGYWHKLNDAATAACTHRGQEFTVGSEWPVTFVCDGPHLLMYLPGGRRMIYRNARVEATVPAYLKGTGKTIPSVTYTSPRFGDFRIPMYPGKWTENVVQAISRDIMANSIVNLERDGFPILFHVHDEAGGRGRYSRKSAFMSAFTTCPDWATNFPLDAEGGWLPRYSKTAPPGDRFKEELWRNGAFVKIA